MPKGRREPIGLGEYQRPGAHLGAVRSLFAVALANEAPDVVVELAGVSNEDQAMAWAHRWSLGVPWVADLALRTGELWRTHASAQRYRMMASPITTGELVPEPEPFTWAPTVETEAQFRARVEEYIDRVRIWAGEVGLVPGVERRQLQRDLSAFISYQVQGWDLSAVIDEYFTDASDDAARKALSRIAVDLGVRLRK